MCYDKQNVGDKRCTPNTYDGAFSQKYLTAKRHYFLKKDFIIDNLEDPIQGPPI